MRYGSMYLPSLKRLRGWALPSVLVPITGLTALVHSLYSHSSQSIAGNQPITGAFEQVLGQTFDPSKATRTVLSQERLTFWYPAPVQIPELTEFFVFASPFTLRIYGIAASGKSDGQKACLDTAEALFFGIVAQKYGGDQYGADLHEYKDGSGWFLTQSKTGRGVKVFCNTGEVTMFYADDALMKSAEVEQQELSQLDSDFEAAHYDKILPRIRELAEQGGPWAETMLALMYRRGGGVPHDDEKAEEYYLRAAQRGWMAAEYNLGTFYRTQFRYKQAEIWLLKAANQGYPEAEENLAQLYLDKSPLQSEDKAFVWLLRAAEHGRPESQYNTCFDYADGLGVKRDMVEAYKWCYIAAYNGQRQAGPNRDHLAKQMRPEEVARGREAAERWLAEHAEPK